MKSSERQPKAKRGFQFSLDFLQTHEGTSRLEAFSDGIFSIAATLLVVDIKVPPGLYDPERLVDAVLRLWPNLFSYGLSFIYLGVYWSHHFHLFSLFKRTDHLFFKINILFLMMIAFIPFPTALLAEYLEAPGGTRQIAVLVYAGSLFVTASLFLAIWLYATHKRRLVDQDLDDAVIRENTMKYLFAPVGYALSFLLAFWSPAAGLALVMIVSIYYLIPFQVFRFD